MILQWDYDSTNSHGHFEVIMKDRTHWITGSISSAVGSVFPVTQITDRNGNSIYLNYGATSVSTASYGFPLLTSITTGVGGSGTALLTIQRATGSSGSILSVTDNYGRSVYYHNSLLNNVNIYQGFPQAYQEVDHVSEIVPTGAASPPDRWAYGYEAVFNGENNGSLQEKVNLLHSISVPSPSGTPFGASTAYIWYSSDPTSSNPNYVAGGSGTPAAVPFVSALVDANGNQRLYTSVNTPGNPPYPSNYTKVTVKNASGIAYTYTVGYDTNMNETSRTDGAGNVIESITYDPVKIYQPVSITDGNGNATNYSWDTFNNLTQLRPPSNGTRTTAFTTNTYDFTNFVLGELTQTQEGTNLATPKQPTTYTYVPSTGLLQTINTPLPGTGGGATTVQTSFTYDNLGNVVTITRPGNNAVSSSMTKFDYSYDGTTFIQNGAIGQPVAVTDQLGEVTHLRYDGQGNTISVTDALGHETDLTYDIRNMPLTTSLPATGQSGPSSGHAQSQLAYLYQMPASLATTQWPAATLEYGPLYTTTQTDEGNVGAIRQIVNRYGAEGELDGVGGSTVAVGYTYDALYRLKWLTDVTGNSTVYFYNTAGYLYQVAYPLSHTSLPTAPLTPGYPDTVTFGNYDYDGNVTSRTDGNNVTTNYTYADPESLLTASLTRREPSAMSPTPMTATDGVPP